MAGRVARAWLGGCWAAAGRLRPLGLLSAAAMVLFTAFRVVFLLHNKGSIRAVSAAEVVECLRVGWFYDTAALCYFAAPVGLVLLAMPRRRFDGRRFRLGWSALTAGLFAGFVLACVSDLFFFDHYADRLNYLAFSYPVFRLEVLAMIWRAYPVGWALAAVAVVGAGGCLLFRRLGWPRAAHAEPAACRAAVAALLIGLALWGAAGPPSRSRREISASHICKEYVVNRASLNCVGTLGRALFDCFAETSVRPEEYGFVASEEAFAVARKLLLMPGDVPAETPGNPLGRITASPAAAPAGRPPPNVVIVVMESMASQYVESLGGEQAWTPELEAIGERGVMFDRLYAVGTRTGRALVGVLSGFPDLPGLPVAQNPNARGRFMALADLLAERGYHTLFIHGGNLEFNDIKRHVRGHGFQTVVDRQDFDEHVRQKEIEPFGPPGEAAFTTFWSVDDQSLFLRADRMLCEQRGPFFAVILTLTNHPTYEVPHDVFDWTVRRDHPSLPAEMSEEQRAVRYADWAVGDFVRRARRQPYFANTLFVFVADHCRSQRPAYPVDAANFHIYASMLGPAELIGPPRRIATVLSQADLAPTILARLGGASRHCFFGRDAFRVEPDDGFALLQENGSIGFLRGRRLMCISPGRPGPLVEGFRLVGRDQVEWGRADPAEADALRRLHRQGLGLFQSAVALLQSRNYHVGP